MFEKKSNNKSSNDKNSYGRSQLIYTQPNINIISSTGVLLGKIWLLILKCLSPNKILAVYPSFDPPSSFSCCLLLLECINRYGQLPQSIGMVSKREFRGMSLKRLLDDFCCQVTYPPSFFLQQNRAGDYGEAFLQFVCLTLDQQPEKDHPLEMTFGEFIPLLRSWAYDEGHFDITNIQIGKLNTPMPGGNVHIYREASFIPKHGILVNRCFYWSDELSSIENTQKLPMLHECHTGRVLVLIGGEWVECAPGKN